MLTLALNVSCLYEFHDSPTISIYIADIVALVCWKYCVLNYLPLFRLYLQILNDQ